MSFLSKEEKINLVQKAMDKRKSLSETYDRLYDMFGDNDFEDVVWDMFDDYLAVVEELIGDDDHMLSVFIFDNECGESEYYPIYGKFPKTPKKFVKVLRKYYEGELEW